MVQMKAAVAGTGKNQELMEARALVCRGSRPTSQLDMMRALTFVRRQFCSPGSGRWPSTLRHMSITEELDSNASFRALLPKTDFVGLGVGTR